MKKILYHLFVALCAVTSSCDSSTADEPEEPDTPDTPTEEKSDYTVWYTESSHQNPNWNEIVNRSAECTNWKKLYKDYLIDHSSTGNNERWVWVFTHKDCTPTQLGEYVDRFIGFTLMPEPNATGSNGIDLFTARVIHEGYSVEYSYNPNAAFDEATKSGWVVKFHAYLNGSLSAFPYQSEFNLWKENNKGNITSESKSENAQSYEWTIYLNNVDGDYIESTVIPFVKWSMPEAAPKQEIATDFRVSVHNYKTPKTMQYTAN